MYLTQHCVIAADITSLQGRAMIDNEWIIYEFLDPSPLILSLRLLSYELGAKRYDPTPLI